MTVAELLNRPWGYIGPQEVIDDHGLTHCELRISELPGFFVAGETREDVMRELRPALTAFLRSYLDYGEEPPMPLREGWLFGPFGPTKPTLPEAPKIRVNDRSGPQAGSVPSLSIA